jgi:hypothetical protein
MTGKGKGNEGEAKACVQKLYGKQPADLLLQHQGARQDCGAFGAAKQSQMDQFRTLEENQEDANSHEVQEHDDRREQSPSGV